MVGWNPANREEVRNDSKLSLPKDSPSPLFAESDDSLPSLHDPFFDFNFIDDWILDHDPVMTPNDDMIEKSSWVCSKSQVGISGETHQENCRKDVLGSNGSVSKLVEQGFSREIGAQKGTDCKEVEFGVLGVSIEKEMEKVSLVVACDDGGSVVYDVPSGEGDGSLVSGSEKISTSNENGSGGSEVNVRDTMVNMESNVTSKSYKQSAEIAVHKDESDGGGADSNDSSDSSSSSSSEEDEDSDDDDGDNDEEEEDEDEGKDVDIEEGEIRNLEKEEIALSSGDEEDGAVKGPIRSKNELEILPPVPPVDVVLQPHHQTLPVGVVLSIMGSKVIVEGAEKHNPLNEGSILWITETRVPLGLIDEIFGPVKNPYYVVRYNSEKEFPAGICQGTAVSFVADFADHILNDKNLYKKGYDASGENDEELSEEVEFSDDEKEAEYKRLRQMAKRGKDDRKHGISESVRQKKVQVKGGFRQNLQHPIPTSPGRMGPQGPTSGGLNFVPSQVEGPSLPVPLGCGSCGCSHGPGQVGGSGPPVPHMTQPMGYLGGPTLHSLPQSNPVWSNGMPFQQQLMHSPSEFSMNGMHNHQQPNHYHQHHQQHLQMFASFPNGTPYQPQFNPSQMQGFPNGIPFQPQFNPSQMQIATSGPFAGNLCVGSTPTSQTGNMGIGFFNQLPFGMGVQSQGHHPHSYGCMGEQGDSSSGQLPPSTIQGGFSAPRQFSPGMASNRGRMWPPRGGRSNFYGGRGPKTK
ncbi:H/ACA ribonucleoprotein complex non-core subunit NAF1-like protein [Cinnamomum micranthum f. kanehirae]|uniref:H/ACA ribonucleoprotein complex non-core subunit NAF1 n=1 Tax=Cinnamomum micranthum f. kanehirae TaxID=337451 RepID=A0A3S3N9C5_9MAGN|nr:H/ACA ribonucleoprotein complex non-core subunit NAF1-like protein [Cinnamomum micranthum f. kanehirae]